jgi:uncharacterized protein (TIGR03905 family)
MYEYATKGTCCRRISVELDGKIIKDLVFEGGCNGNLKAIRLLVIGHDIDEIIPLLRGNLCRNKGTSCADQLTYALEAAYKAASA